MKIFKKLLLMAAAFGLMLLPVQAKSQFGDVKEGYWAYNEIASVVADGTMSLASGKNFVPEGTVKRVEFVQMLLKVLGHKDLVVNTQNTFQDVTRTTTGYYDILKSKQLGLVYGYPDGNFLPERLMSKAEVTSVMSHITKGDYKDLSVLKGFVDVDKIPAWAKYQYTKTTKLGLYVNHPDVKAFEPERNITRAEVAVLLYKLKNSLNHVQDKYLGKSAAETVLGTEHLNVYKKAATNEVTITNLRKIIKCGNVLKVKFCELFKSKKSDEGDVVSFVFDKDVYTQEGTLVIPSGSKLYATVTEIIPTKWFNKNARVGLHFTKLELCNGKVMNFDGSPNTKDGYLKEGPWETAGKITAYTLGGTALGAGVGVAAGVPTDNLDVGLGVGIPVGAGVGLAGGLITKGLNYVGHEGDAVLIKLNSDVSVYN